MIACRRSLLLVEDNPGDVDLILEGLGAGSSDLYDIAIAPDGVDALARLRRLGAYSAATHPDVVLLDLNLPKKSGRDVLAEIKTDPELLHIPVVILTSSAAPGDILGSYRGYASCCVTKPVDLDAFLSVVKAIETFWFSVVKLPSTEGRE